MTTLLITLIAVKLAVTLCGVSLNCFDVISSKIRSFEQNHPVMHWTLLAATVVYLYNN